MTTTEGVVWEGMEATERAQPAGNGARSATLPPHDHDAERAVLGAALLQPELIPELAGILRDDDMHHPAHVAIWRAITDRAAKGEPVDTHTVGISVGTDRTLAALGGPLYVADLADAIPAVSSATYYARIVADRGTNRRTVELGTWLQQAGHTGTDPDIVRTRIEKHLAGTGPTSGGRYEQLRDAVLDADGLKNITPPTPLVGRYIAQDSLTWLQGKPGHGKSFVAIDLACSVATGQPWRGEAVHQGPVLYIIAEGAAGTGRRVDAWRHTHGQQDMPAIRFLPIPVQLLDPLDHHALARLVADIAPTLVVIDTQARVTVGAEENSSRDMGMFVAAADAIREASGACVLVVHHEGRSGEHLRGSTAMEGAATTIMRVSKDGPLVYLECKKQKDDDEFDEIVMRLVKLGDSAVLSHENPAMAEITTETEHQLITTLRDSFGPEGVAATNLREAAGLPKSTFFRALRNLTDRRIVTDIGRSKSPRYVLAASQAHHQSSLSADEEGL